MLGRKEPTVEQFMAKHRDEVMKYLFDEQKGKWDYQMEIAFIDSAGHTYRRFTGADRPLERIGKAQDYMIMMSSGLTDEELSELIAEADNQLALALSGKKHSITSIGWILKEILERKNLILHPELYYNFLAVQVVREDEPVNEFVESIQREKVAQFKKDNRDNTFFFFQVPELTLVNSLLKFTESEWNQYWGESQKRIEKTKMMLKRLNGAKESSVSM